MSATKQIRLIAARLGISVRCWLPYQTTATSLDDILLNGLFIQAVSVVLSNILFFYAFEGQLRFCAVACKVFSVMLQLEIVCKRGIFFDSQFGYEATSRNVSTVKMTHTPSALRTWITPDQYLRQLPQTKFLSVKFFKQWPQLFGVNEVY